MFIFFMLIEVSLLFGDALSLSINVNNKNNAYFLEPRQPIPYSVQQQKRSAAAFEQDEVSGFFKLKNGLYSFVDTCSGILAAFRANDRSISGNRPTRGYKDSVETPALLALKTNSPGVRLMRNLEEQQEKQPSQLKDVVYSALDAVTEITKTKETPAVSSSILFSNFKPAVQPSLQSSFDLANNDSGIVVRKFPSRIRVDKVKQRFIKLKNFAIGLVDGVAAAPATVKTSAAVLQETVQSAASAVRSGIQTVQDAPNNIRETLQEVQKSVKEASQIAEVVVQDVQNIPMGVREKIKKVQNIPNEVQRKVKDVEDFVVKIQEDAVALNQRVKILAGLESPPPPPPPAPPTPQEMAKKQAFQVVNGVAKASWWIGKGVVGLCVQGVKAAWNYSTQKKKKLSYNAVSDERTGMESKPNAANAARSARESNQVARQQAILSEIDEALRLAEEALGEKIVSPSIVDKPSNVYAEQLDGRTSDETVASEANVLYSASSEKTKKAKSVDEALKRATESAAATKEIAVEVERILTDEKT
eukprot:CAMPEP_0172420884 /NCGR_PEP_ID=MMETSP1064-20121228/7198_1 /TAXON_ID=202472 /ORGANISM="Aulacoseira subarctica , Strain CCAP 1002/5" /LENGTH=530 /DNA_ID=CAMNT_0013161027 /DNA_START=91 /DNA_END=1683 /DNA_ORIENTATION=-